MTYLMHLASELIHLTSELMHLATELMHLATEPLLGVHQLSMGSKSV